MKNQKHWILQENNYRNRTVDEYHVHTFHALSLAEFFALTAISINTLAFVTNIFLTAYVNRINLNDPLNFLQIYSIPIILHVGFFVALWMLFVYKVYDHYGL